MENVLCVSGRVCVVVVVVVCVCNINKQTNKYIYFLLLLDILYIVCNIYYLFILPKGFLLQSLCV